MPREVRVVYDRSDLIRGLSVDMAAIGKLDPAIVEAQTPRVKRAIQVARSVGLTLEVFLLYSEMHVNPEQFSAKREATRRKVIQAFNNLDGRNSR